MIALRRWPGRVNLSCLLALMLNVLVVLSLACLPLDALMRRLLSATFSIVLLAVAVVILMQAIDFVGLLFGDIFTEHFSYDNITGQ